MDNTALRRIKKTSNKKTDKELIEKVFVGSDTVKEINFIAGRIAMIQFIIIILGVYSLALTVLSNSIEFNEDYNNKSLKSSLMYISISCFIMQIFVIAKHKFIVKLAILRKEVVPETTTREYFTLKFI